MTIKDLIKALSNFNPELEIRTWHDHEIFEITYLTGDINEWVHINLGEKQ